MKKIDCLVERPANLAIAFAIFMMAVGMSVIGVTLLPVIGLMMAVPIFALSGFFAFSPKSKECTL